MLQKTSILNPQYISHFQSRQIGKGGFGVVYQIKIQSPDDMLKLHSGHLNEQQSLTEDRDTTQRVCQFYETLTRKQQTKTPDVIVKSISHFESAQSEMEMTSEVARATLAVDFTGCLPLFGHQAQDISHLVMEPVSSDDGTDVQNLFQYLDKLDDDKKSTLARDLVDSVYYFGDVKTIGLLDLKSENCLVAIQQGQARLKLIDFADSVRLGDSDQGKLSGTRYMMPPELIRLQKKLMDLDERYDDLLQKSKKISQSDYASQYQLLVKEHQEVTKAIRSGRAKHVAWSTALLLFEIFSGKSFINGEGAYFREQYSKAEDFIQALYAEDQNLHRTLSQDIIHFANDSGNNIPDVFRAYMKQCVAFNLEDRQTVQEVLDQVEPARVEVIEDLREQAREALEKEALLKQKDQCSAEQSAERLAREEAIKFETLAREEAIKKARLSLMLKCIGLVSFVGGVVGGAFILQATQIINMNKIAISGLNVAINMLNTLGVSIGSINALGTLSTIAVLAGGITLSLISIGLFIKCAQSAIQCVRSRSTSITDEPFSEGRALDPEYSIHATSAKDLEQRASQHHERAPQSSSTNTAPDSEIQLGQ